MCIELRQPAFTNQPVMAKYWSRLSAFFDYPPEIRKVIYKTNAIESLNASLRQVTKTRRSFPNDDAMDNADKGLETSHEAIHYHVW